MESIIIKKGEDRTNLYEIVIGEYKIYAHSKEDILRNFGSMLIDSTEEIEVINKLNEDDCGKEVMIGIEQLVRCHNAFAERYPKIKN